jgi:hypothetical protein
MSAGITVRENAEKDPNYRPYCMRCKKMPRMEKVAPFYWRCACGAEHDVRRPDEWGIDWSKHDTFPESTNTCRCGAVFRAHTKAVFDPAPGGKARIVSRKPCPECGTYANLSGSSSDPETMTIRGDGR